MKVLLFVVGVLLGQSAVAQANQSVPDAGSNAASPMSYTNATPHSCELHIFPTLNYEDSSPDYSVPSGGLVGGLIGSALHSAETSGTGRLIAAGLAQLRAALTPQVQVAEIKSANILALLKLPVDTEIVVDPPLYSGTYLEATKHGTAISSSASPCYRELIVVGISLSKGLGSLKFSSGFIYRVFTEQHVERHLYDGERSLPKPAHFPSVSLDQIGLAKDEMRSSFRQALTDWIAHRVKV